jgi:predicted AAA+ superfamily ATPase
MAASHGTGSEADLRAALEAARSLVLYRGVLDDDVGRAFLALAAAPGGGAGARLFALLARHAELYRGEAAGDAWQNWLVDRILFDENPFSLKAEAAGWDGMGPALRAAARRDLENLEALFRHPPLPDLQGFRGLPGPAAPAIKRRLAATRGWAELAPAVAAHHAVAGAGTFARYRGFRWWNGALEPVPEPDPVRLEDLVGYERERAVVIENTERFLSGLPAHDLLLYGDRGTGKSSTVKALLTAYGDRGLRLVEMPRWCLRELPILMEVLRGRRQRFIVFVDDLSFEEAETGYKDAKTAIEGGLAARPDNVVVYATSNRRHLVRERTGDRDDHDFRSDDTVEEKLSLADRFGMTVIFPSPDQELYLSIVSSLAARRNLPVDPGQLRQQALQWALWYNGRSGRTARQFVDHLAAQLGDARAARRGAGA